MSEPVRGPLVVFCGLPGVGKTALSRGVADRIGATFLRVDSIESAIVSTLQPFSDNPVAYVVAARVAGDQLRAGRPVVADAVNAVEPAREGWRALAREHDVPLRWVHVVCSDAAEHRARVEQRRPEMPGHFVPTWERVLARPWEPFTDPHLVVDNLGDPDRHVQAVTDWLGGPGTQ